MVRKVTTRSTNFHFHIEEGLEAPDGEMTRTKSPFNRKLFYVGAIVPGEILAGLELRGWEVSRVAHLGRGQIRAEMAGAAAGIADFTQPFDHEWMALQMQSANLMSISWIALVSSQIKQIPEVEAFIATHCVDFITLPSSNERVFDGVEHALKMALLFATSISPSTTSTIIGTSKPMRILNWQLNKAAMSDASVFLSGESGTGKELSARMLHERSSRRDGPFIAINCGSMSVDLLHSELFGYERGAFTGAMTQKLGRIEAANGGTLFLDEIGDLPRDCQSALLRFLQERRIDRLGATKPVEVDVRVVVATHVDMNAA
jgi:DNA-binding NtrC family response regulator